MPLTYSTPSPTPQTPSSAPRSRLGIGSGAVQPSAPYEAPEPSGPGIGTAVLGAGAVGGVLYAGSKLKDAPGILGKIGKGAAGLNAIRQQLMLTGLALPKSLLGNTGAAINASSERGSMAPLKELFKGQTVRDAIQSFKSGSGAVLNPASAHGEAGVQLPKWLSAPGRAMGAMDEATQNALVRASDTPQARAAWLAQGKKPELFDKFIRSEAARETLQTPLSGGLADAFRDNPLAQYAVPFRRTPFNQFIEGMKSMNRDSWAANPGTNAATLALGASHGAATSDDSDPMSVLMAIAMAGRRGLPYGAAALAGRALAGGKNAASIAGGMTPISDYGLTQSFTDPTKSFRQPAALTALEKITGRR